MKRSIRLAAVLLSLVLFCGCCSSCSWFSEVAESITGTPGKAHGLPGEDDTGYEHIVYGEIAYSPHYEPVVSRYSYEMLSDEEKALYDALLENVFYVHPQPDEDQLYKVRQVVLEGVQLSTAQIRVVNKALYDDNPSVFWISGTLYHLTSVKENYTAVQLRSYYSPEELKSKTSAVTEALESFYGEIPSGLDAYGREKYTHDYLIDHCEYDEKIAEERTLDAIRNDAYTVYGSLVKRLSVCEGYARSMQLLLNGLGVDCVGVTGVGYTRSGGSDLHMWDAVKLDDGWYYADPTWDDQIEAYWRYEYFNLDETSISDDHEPSRLLADLTEDEINGEATFSSAAMNIFLPDCHADTFNYYIYECPHLVDYDGSAVTDSLYEAALRKDEYFTVYIDPDALDYDSAINQLFKQHPQYFFGYVRKVNGMLWYYEIDSSNLLYYTNKKRSTVTVQLNYY